MQQHPLCLCPESARPASRGHAFTDRPAPPWAGLVPRLPQVRPTTASMLAADDWPTLHRAVQARLQGLLDKVPTDLRPTTEALLDCGRALQQLHAMLRRDGQRRQQLEFELFDLRMARSMARAESRRLT